MARSGRGLGQIEGGWAPDPVAAGSLGGVHGAVGGIYEGLDLVRVVGVGGDTDGDGDVPEGPAVVADADGPDGPLELVGMGGLNVGAPGRRRRRDAG